MKLSRLLTLFVVFIPLLCLGQQHSVDFKEMTEESKVSTLLELSEQFSFSNPDTAIHYASRALDILKDEENEAMAHAYKILADAYYYHNEFEKAIEYYGQSGEVEKKISGEYSVAYASRLNDVGYCYYVMGIYELAAKYYNEALFILEKTGDKEEMHATCNNLGTVYFNWGDYEEAIKCFEKTLEYDEKQENTGNLSITLNNIGKVYQAWGKYDLAIDYISKALDMARKGENRDSEAIRMSNLGMVYFEMGNTNKALSLLRRALIIDSTSGNEFKVSIRKSEISRILASQGNYYQAIDHSLEALDFFSEANILESKAIVSNDLGDYYRALKDYPMSAEAYLRSVSISQESHSDKTLMNSYAGLSRLFEEWGDPAQAFYYYKKYDSIDHNIFNAEKHKQLANFEIKYQTREKEIENELLKSENKQKHNRLVLLTIGIISLFFIILLLIVSVRLKNKNIKQQKILAEHERLEKEKEKHHFEDKIFAEKQINRLQREQYQTNLEHKNQKLANLTLGLVQKNEFLIRLKEEIKDADSGKEMKKKEIIRLINQNIDIDQDWQRFKLEFSEIHPGYFDALISRFPELSEIFVQLCAYLRINLSSKEIANLQNISVAAVNKNRQRLRKKLGLEPEADLTEFLRKLSQSI